MSHNSGFARFLRFIGIVLMALTAGFTLLGGVGTACAAFAPTDPKWANTMGPLAQMQWLYIFYVLAGVAIGLAGIRAVVLLVKGDPKAYRDTLIALLTGIFIGAIHIATSRMLRGKSQPVDMVVYTTVLTLAVFLVFRIPAIWQGVNYDKNKSNPQISGGASAIVMGFLCLAIPTLAGETHTWNAANYADAFHAWLAPFGWLLVVGGVIAFFIAGMRLLAQKAALSQQSA